MKKSAVIIEVFTQSNEFIWHMKSFHVTETVAVDLMQMKWNEICIISQNKDAEKKDCSVPSVMDSWTMICDRKQRLVGFSFKMLS